MIRKEFNIFRRGSLVTLRQDKSYFDGQDNIVLPVGTSGLVTQIRKVPSGQPQIYVVDFGPHGGLNCQESELNGEDVGIIPADEEEHGRIEETLAYRSNGTSSDPVEELFEEEEESNAIDFERDLKKRIAQYEKEIV